MWVDYQKNLHLSIFSSVSKYVFTLGLCMGCFKCVLWSGSQYINPCSTQLQTIHGACFSLAPRHRSLVFKYRPPAADASVWKECLRCFEHECTIVLVPLSDDPNSQSSSHARCACKHLWHVACMGTILKQKNNSLKTVLSSICLFVSLCFVVQQCSTWMWVATKHGHFKLIY
jgi:hypothetical protein